MNYELTPTDSHKSFYGKATVIEKNGVKTLISYSTLVAKIDKSGKIYRLWDGWSATTGRHIASFCGLNKREFEKLPLSK